MGVTVGDKADISQDDDHVAGQKMHIIQQLKEFYADFSVTGIEKLDNIYTQDIEFRDPVHTLLGRLALLNYLRRMAADISLYSIRYLDESVGTDSAYFTWELDFAHRSIRGGKQITVRGMTQIRFTHKIYYHEDCYDLGALVYDHLPLLGPATRYVKSRLTGH